MIQKNLAREKIVYQCFVFIPTYSFYMRAGLFFINFFFVPFKILNTHMFINAKISIKGICYVRWLLGVGQMFSELNNIDNEKIVVYILVTM